MKSKGILLALLALGAAVGGFFISRYFERQRCAEQSAAMIADHQAAVAGLRTAGERWAEAVAKGQGDAVLRAFVSGITPSILSERRESLEISAVSLLRVRGVDGIHILKPDGGVLYSSDAKLVTLGNAGDAGAWALAASELASRAGARPGTLEFAVPVVDSGRVLAVVWMRFGLLGVRDAERPAQWVEAPAVPAVPGSVTGVPATAQPSGANAN